METDGVRVPPTRLWVTEPARGRMGPPQGHTAGWNNSHSTGQTVSQNNFIVPEIGVECTVQIGRGRNGGGGGEVEQWEGKEKGGGGVVGNCETGVLEKVQSGG